VRAAAQAGAGAVALTLGLRLLRTWLTGPQAAREAVSSALPTLADLIQQRGLPGPAECAPGERGAEVVETLVYMQRVVRRR
jgi:hypothetical protein